jgi:tetratricopeptide (TPR) repeat protein
LILARLQRLAVDDPVSAGEHYATARFHVANLLLQEGEARRANELLTAALTASDSAWPVQASILNNRGITWLQLDRDESAVADFTSVIDSPAASEEARACALNNRADVREHRDLEAAIADRTAVMNLTNTSPDRRYIALARRARERWALSDRRGTFDDHATILETEDIAVEQKMETRLQRAELLLQLGRVQEALADLQAVVDSRRNFDNVEEAARQLVAKVSRA